MGRVSLCHLQTISCWEGFVIKYICIWLKSRDVGILYLISVNVGNSKVCKQAQNISKRIDWGIKILLGAQCEIMLKVEKKMHHIPCYTPIWVLRWRYTTLRWVQYKTIRINYAIRKKFVTIETKDDALDSVFSCCPWSKEAVVASPALLD